jgi:hypothetical protein
MNKMLLAGLLCLISTVALSAPVLFTLKNLNFRSIFPITGACEIDQTSGQVSDLPGSRLCNLNLIGQTGEYQIVATPNKILDIKFLHRLPVNSDGLTFIPSGTITSDVETVTIIANNMHQIDTGTSGIVDVVLAGQLYMSKEFIGGITYNIVVTDGIEFSERP